MASKCYYDILTNNVLPLSYRRSNTVASRYYVLRYSKKRVTVWSTYVSETCIPTSRLEILYVQLLQCSKRCFTVEILYVQ